VDPWFVLLSFCAFYWFILLMQRLCRRCPGFSAAADARAVGKQFDCGTARRTAVSRSHTAAVHLGATYCPRLAVYFSCRSACGFGIFHLAPHYGPGPPHRVVG
jgi:hypothetical protein